MLQTGWSLMVSWMIFSLRLNIARDEGHAFDHALCMVAQYLETQPELPLTQSSLAKLCMAQKLATSTHHVCTCLCSGKPHLPILLAAPSDSASASAFAFAVSAFAPCRDLHNFPGHVILYPPTPSKLHDAFSTTNWKGLSFGRFLFDALG